MTNKHKVKDKDNLFRDISSNAIINNNSNAFENRKKQLETLKEKDSSIEEMSLVINELRSRLVKVEKQLKGK